MILNKAYSPRGNVVRFLAAVLALFFPLSASGAGVHFEKALEAGSPMSVAVDETGRIYTTQEEKGVRVLDGNGETLMTFGGEDGEGAGVLRYPSGIALDGDTVYVTDLGLHKVILFSMDGEYLDSFGSRGSDPKEFDSPGGVFVREGIIFVADSGNNRVQVFGPNGVYAGTIGNRGKDKELIDWPAGVAADYRGHVYALDGRTGTVKVYDSSGRFQGALIGLRMPTSIAMGGDGFFVSDMNLRGVRKYGFDWQGITSFGLQEESGQRFRNISGMDAGGDGKVYIADNLSGLIYIFRDDSGGERNTHERVPPPTTARWETDIAFKAEKLVWDQEGDRLYAVSGDGGAIVLMEDSRIANTISIPDWRPVSMAVDAKGFLWVVNGAGNRLMKLDMDGNVLLSIGSTGREGGQFSDPKDIVLSNDGFIYVADYGNRRVQKLTAEGEFVNIVGKGGTSFYIKHPRALAMGKDGILYVLDEDTCTVMLYSPTGLPLKEFGGRGSGRGEFSSPADIAVTENEVFVLDEGTHRVQVFSLKGNFLREFGAEGSGKGDFHSPASIEAISDVKLMVSDTGNERIQVLSMVYSPSPPQGLKTSAGPGNVELAWDKNPETYVEYYRVYRNEGGGFRELAKVTGNRYVDGDVAPGATYRYRVSAVARGGHESGMSDSKSAKP